MPTEMGVCERNPCKMLSVSVVYICGEPSTCRTIDKAAALGQFHYGQPMFEDGHTPFFTLHMQTVLTLGPSPLNS